MIRLGLVGKDIAHSQSQLVYEEILKKVISYELFDFESESELPDLEFLFEKVQGLSITSPYKKSYSSKVSILGDVAALGIINCVRKSGNKYEATNTDFLAVSQTIEELDKNKFDFILLGNGSMAEITKFVLEKANVDFLQLSRTTYADFPDLDLTKLKKEKDKDLFVINSCSRNYIYTGAICEGITFWDYNYGHKEHISRLKNSSIRYIDGMALLKSQAVHALKFWNINY